MSLNVKDFLDLEAEEGSDNEEHDDKIKSIAKNEKEESDEENEDPNRNLEELIDENQTESIKDKKLIRDKFKEEELSKDKKMIKEVIDGNFKCKKRKWIDLKKENAEFEEGEEEKKLHIGRRKKLISSLNNSQDPIQESSYRNKKIINVSKYKRNIEMFSEDDKETTSEFDEILLNYEKDIKKKISEQSSAFKRKLHDRIKENNQILENVIDLNKMQKNPQQASAKSGNPFLSFSSSQMSQNSLLNAIKKDKYYSQKDLEKNSQKSNEVSRGNSLFPMFNTIKNKQIPNSEKKNKISAIFTKRDVTQKIKMK